MNLKLMLYSHSMDIALVLVFDNSNQPKTLSLRLSDWELSLTARNKSSRGRLLRIGPNSPMPIKVVHVTATLKDAYTPYNAPTRLHHPPTSWHHD
ncbi:hypothetical protein Pelo_9135 [Pelomyxa schiedti]|nr:hypothetical protein Pelo_9135 [Pelomyxa schiedti]